MGIFPEKPRINRGQREGKVGAIFLGVRGIIYMWSGETDRTKGGDPRVTVTMEQILDFWSEVMNDPEQKTADRMKASENLAKYLSADFENDRELNVSVEYR
jgi:hypothetical protein